jgi:hypothetical protein
MTKASINRRNKFLQEIGGNILFKIWVGLERVDVIDDVQTRENFRNWYGFPPKFITDSIEQWGGLTPKQFEFAVKKFNEVMATGRDRYEAIRSAKDALIRNGVVWSAGRRELALEILTVKERMWGPKLLGQTPDGLKLWVSVPNNSGVGRGDRIRMTVTIKPSEDDPTFAFGSRPSKWARI